MNDTTQELWRTEFDRQCTPELFRVLYKQTTALVRRCLRNTPARGADLGVLDRIHTAAMKLCDGSRVWDPERVDLGNFLLGVVASDLSAELCHATRFPETSLDEPPPTPRDDYTGEPIPDTATSLASTTRGPAHDAGAEHASLDRAWSVAMPHLREAAAKDRDVLVLLAAYDQGVYARRDVMRQLRWNSNKYQRVYRRLLHVASSLDDDIRDVVAQCLAN
jgi:hypothetical protein